MELKQAWLVEQTHLPSELRLTSYPCSHKLAYFTAQFNQSLFFFIIPNSPNTLYSILATRQRITTDCVCCVHLFSVLSEQSHQLLLSVILQCIFFPHLSQSDKTERQFITVDFGTSFGTSVVADSLSSKNED